MEISVPRFLVHNTEEFVVSLGLLVDNTFKVDEPKQRFIAKYSRMYLFCCLLVVIIMCSGKSSSNA